MSVSAQLISISSEILEKKFGAGFVGSVILGFVTTLPELFFVYIAVMAMRYDVAMGSAIGGNILLFTLGYGLVILITYAFHKKPIVLDSCYLRDDLWYLLVSTLIITAAALDGIFHLYEGVILIGIYVVYVAHQYHECRRFKIIPGDDSGETPHPPEKITRREWAKSGILLLVGGAMLLLAAEPFVIAIEDLSHIMLIPALFLSLVISPMASEMPEKISAFVLSSKSEEGAEIAIANFVGSKVQNNSLLFGMMITVAAVVVGTPIVDTGRDMLLLIVMALTTIVGVKLTYDMKLHPKEGVLSLILYVVAIIAVFIINM
jgi:cation:H+ antiporter